MRRSRIVRALFPIGLLTMALFAGGCASPVPGQVGGSGRALQVTMTFSAYPDPNSFFYFFAINRYGTTGDVNARGPVAVYDYDYAGSAGGTGNGFATGSGGSTTGLAGGPAKDYGLTDYVLIAHGQSTSPDGNIGLYHVPGTPTNPGDPNTLGSPVNGVQEGAPATYTLPDPTSQSNPTTITFRLNIQQLATDQEVNASGQSAAQIAAAIRYLQVNIIATNRIPVSQIPDPTKQVDAMGYPTSTSSDARGRFLIIDLTRVGQTYSSTDGVSNLQEQAGDVYPPGADNPNIDLTSWSIQVVNVGG